MMPARCLALALAALFAFAGPVGAEEVVLASGTRYDADAVELLRPAPPGVPSVRFQVRLGGGRATMTLPFERIQPASLLSLVGARTDLTRGEGQLELARLAFDGGLYPQAERAFRRAGELDPALEADAARGLAAIADVGAARSLTLAEADLAAGRADLALSRARGLAAGRPPGDPLAARASAVAGLAEKVAERDRARHAAKTAAAAKAQEDAARRTFEDGLTRADAAVEDALRERARAGDPDRNGTDVLRALESARARLVEARRLLGTIFERAGPRLPEVEARDRDVFSLLLATYLELSEFSRERGRFDRARDYARAAAILAPEDTRVRDVRDRIDRDLAVPPPPPYYDPFDLGLLGSFAVGGYGGGYVGGYGGGGCGVRGLGSRGCAYRGGGSCGGWRGGGCGGSGFAFGFRW